MVALDDEQMVTSVTKFNSQSLTVKGQLLIYEKNNDVRSLADIVDQPPITVVHLFGSDIEILRDNILQGRNTTYFQERKNFKQPSKGCIKIREVHP